MTTARWLQTAPRARRKPFRFEHVKSGDVVNVGNHRGDKEDMVEENARIVTSDQRVAAAATAEGNFRGFSVHVDFMRDAR